MLVLVAGFAACGGKARNQHKNACELPEAVRSQEERDLKNYLIILTGRPKRTKKLMENNSPASNSKSKLVQVPAGALLLDGNLSIPEDARGIVLLAQGSRNLEDDSSF